MIDKRKFIELDINKVRYNSKGIIDFYWPYDNNCHVKIYSEFTLSFNEYVKGKKSKDVEPLVIFYKWLLSDILSIYKSIKTVELLRESGHSVNIPSHYKITNTFMNSQKLEVIFFENQIKKKLGNKFFVRSLKKILKFFIWNKHFINFFKLKKVTCLSNGKIIDKHARIEKVIRLYAQLRDFFKDQPSFKNLNAKLSSDNQKTTNEVLDLIKKTFESNNVVFDSNINNYFKIWIRHAFNFYNFHSLQLSKQSLPNKLWVGCAGNTIWHVMLTSAVRKRSGKVYAHSHGSPNFEDDQTFENFVDHIHCDELFVENKAYADFKIKYLDSRFMFGKDFPKLNFPSPKTSNLNSKSPKLLQRRIKKIMYVPKPFFGEEARARSAPAEIQYFDWQCRLLGFLSGANIEIIYKPHPGGKSRPCKDFALSFGANEINEPFEQVKEQVDAYIIDFITSTTTHQILNSDLPIIFINLKSPDISEDVKTSLNKRCYVLDSFIDDRNRFRIDNNALSSILNKNEHIFNYDFCNTFYDNIISK